MYLEIIKWIANICIIGAMVIVAGFPEYLNLPYAHLSLVIGSILWSYYAIKVKDLPLLTINVVLGLINFYGFFIRIT